MYNGNKVKTLNIRLAKRSAYVKSYDGQTRWIYCSTEDDDLLETYNIILDKFSADTKKNLIESLSIIKII